MEGVGQDREGYGEAAGKMEGCYEIDGDMVRWRKDSEFRVRGKIDCPVRYCYLGKQCQGSPITPGIQVTKVTLVLHNSRWNWALGI